MNCAYCGRKKRLFEDFKRYNFCEECDQKVRNEIKDKLAEIDSFISNYAQTSNGVERSALLKQIDNHLELLDDLEELRLKAPMFKSSTDKQLDKLIGFKAYLSDNSTHPQNMPVLNVPAVIDGCTLVYHYEDVKVAGVSYAKPNFELLKLCDKVTFVLEPENEVDPKAVAVYCNDIKLGYVHTGTLQDMVNDWIAREEPIFAAISSVDSELQAITFFLAFYRSMLFQLARFENMEFLLTKCTGDRQENLSVATEGEELSCYYDDFDEVYVIISKLGLELGELNTTASNAVNKKESEYDIIPVLSKIGIKDDKYRAKVKVFFKPHS